MPRVKRGTVRRAKRKRLLKRAKGFYANKSKLYRAAKESVDKALNYAYSGRRRKKRDFRRLWVVRINAAAIDVTLPGRAPIIGRKHPLTLVADRVEEIFQSMGFQIIEGPELEDDWHNFEALNMPPDHP